MKSTECKKISSGSDEGGGEGHMGGTCKEVSNVVSSSEGGGGRHPGESALLGVAHQASWAAARAMARAAVDGTRSRATTACVEAVSEQVQASWEWTTLASVRIKS